ncbi:hypothetical protein ACFT2A_35320, partial [Streptomyces sp. NPDC057072]
TRSARTPDTLPTKIVEHKTRSSTHSETISKTAYALYGWTKDNSWSASSISFTLADRDRLTAGQVRYDSISDNGDESAITVSIEEFKAAACQNT